MQVEAPLLAQLLADTQAELLRKAEAAAMWQARAEILASQLSQAQDRIHALEAPKEPTTPEIAPRRDSDARQSEPAPGRSARYGPGGASGECRGAGNGRVLVVRGGCWCSPMVTRRSP